MWVRNGTLWPHPLQCAHHGGPLWPASPTTSHVCFICFTCRRAVPLRHFYVHLSVLRFGEWVLLVAFAVAAFFSFLRRVLFWLPCDTTARNLIASTDKFTLMLLCWNPEKFRCATPRGFECAVCSAQCAV